MNENFRLKSSLIYPPGNTLLFEEFFYNNFNHQNEIDRIYIPIFWTNYYINKNYGNGDLSELQFFLDSLDRNKKYFTIIQYDDNILNDLKDLDILIMAQGGFGKYKERSYPIPLNCISSFNYEKNNEKEIFCSFTGTIKGRHQIREKMSFCLSNNKKYIISENVNYHYFRETMSKSLFSLCPRGYGQTSFRICESLQSNSIPVYIYDEPLIPFKEEFDFSSIGILIPQSDINLIDEILSNISKEKIKNLQETVKIIYKKFFDYNGCFKEIINKLKKIKNESNTNWSK